MRDLLNKSRFKLFAIKNSKASILPVMPDIVGKLKKDLNQYKSVIYNSLIYNNLIYDSLTYNSLTYNSLMYNGFIYNN